MEIRKMKTIVEEFQNTQLNRIRELAGSSEKVNSKELLEILDSDFEKVVENVRS
jgi:hypothetical protein